MDSNPTQTQNGQKMRMDYLERDMKELKDRTKAVEDENEALKIDVARLTERLTFFQLGQGLFTSIAATIAALFGRAGP